MALPKNYLFWHKVKELEYGHSHVYPQRVSGFIVTMEEKTVSSFPIELTKYLRLATHKMKEFYVEHSSESSETWRPDS